MMQMVMIPVRIANRNQYHLEWAVLPGNFTGLSSVNILILENGNNHELEKICCLPFCGM